MTQQCVNHTEPTLKTVLVKKLTLPRCGLVTIQIARHILLFWCGFDWQGVFFLTSAVLLSSRFYTGFIVPKLYVTISHELQLRFQ
jgi:hypothetical protein